MLWCEFRQQEIGSWIAILRGVGEILPNRCTRKLAADDKPVAAPSERGVDGVGQPCANTLPDHESIHYHVDRVASGLGKSDRLWSSQFQDFAVNSNSDKALSFNFFKHIAEFAYFISYQRSDYEGPGLFGISQDLVNDLFRCLLIDLFSG